MCGIAGALHSTPSRGEEELAALAHGMASSLSHRGPDDNGVWVDPDAGIALGHTRLSILDLSPLGHQPMISRCGRYVIVYNGELYNFACLRRALEREGRRFRGHSDTEILLAAISRWGVDAALQRFNGMFAFGVWDRAERSLTLARDRLGEKPLYYGRAGQDFVFASELKALRAHPTFDDAVDRDAVAALLSYGYIPAPYSIYQHIRKLPAGSVVRVRANGGTEQPQPETYWSLRAVAARAPAATDRRPVEDHLEELHALLSDAVSLRMVADVPVGALLSGGIDSSSVTSLMQAQAHRPIRTYSIGFAQRAFDESRYARRVAGHLGTAHTEFVVSGDDALALVPYVAGVYDEPFADASQLPTMLVCRLARRHVKVVLSGDGGDELFGGYRRHRWSAALWRSFGGVPLPIRVLAANALARPRRSTWTAVAHALRAVGVPARTRLADDVAKVARVLTADGSAELYRMTMSWWQEPETVVIGGRGPHGGRCQPSPAAADPLRSMMLLDALRYLPDDILVKVDRASMAVGLECRVPLLDHRVVEHVWTLPLDMKVRRGEGKWILRRMLERYVPPSLYQRPKQGFEVPLAEWLRTSLRGWAGDLLSPERLRRQGLLRPEPIERLWHEHLRGDRDWHQHLWNVLMFQAWLDGAPAAARPASKGHCITALRSDTGNRHLE
jgi:asparagine synthase (glutamine-hydrolysing)